MSVISTNTRENKVQYRHCLEINNSHIGLAIIDITEQITMIIFVLSWINSMNPF